MLEIRVNAIPHNGLNIKAELPLPELNKRINEGESGGITFTSPPKVTLHIEQAVQGATVKGEILAVYKQPCARCLDDLDQEIAVPVTWMLKPRQDGSEEDFDDVGIVGYDSDRIQLEDPLQEALILAVSPILTPATKSGACVVCRKPCPEVVWSDKTESGGTLTLGDLLKTAGHKNGKV